VTLKNLEIRAALKECGLKQWELADTLGISPYTLTVWLRHELPPTKKQRILEAIAEAKRNAKEDV